LALAGAGIGGLLFAAPLFVYNKVAFGSPLSFCYSHAVGEHAPAALLNESGDPLIGTDAGGDGVPGIGKLFAMTSNDDVNAFSGKLQLVVEPRITGRPFERREAVFGLLAIPGVLLVVGGTPVDMRLGIAIGVVSVVLVSVFASLNKRYVTQGDPLVVTGLELGAGTAFLTLVALAWPGASGELTIPDARDTTLLLILALACTLLPFALSLVALRHISAFSAQLAISLEPVYAILLAIVLLGEQRELTLAFYCGVAIILLVVLVHALTNRAR
jgi:hypothetical protein